MFLPIMLGGNVIGGGIGRAYGNFALGMAIGQAVGSIIGVIAVFTLERRARSSPTTGADGSS